MEGQQGQQKMDVDVPASMSSNANAAFNYVVSAQKPTGVVGSLVGSFTDAGALNLLSA